MGFLKKLFTKMYLKNINPNRFVEDIERVYLQCKAESPGMDPHYYLAQTWLTYMGSLGNDINKKDFQVAAFPTTYLIACISYPYYGEALGLFLLHRENPDAFKKFPLLMDNYNRYILPVIEAQETGKIEELYKKNNPNIEQNVALLG